jgi:uncharacterized membrane protein
MYIEYEESEMLNIELIALARAVHVLAGVIWAGATFVLAAVIVPIAARHGAEGAGRWIGLIARKVGPMSGISALLTVLSGVYLFAVLHPNDSSAGGLVLKTGAVAALLSLGIGFLVGRPTGLKLAKLSQQSSPAAAAPDMLQKVPALYRRAVLSSRLTAALLGIAVLSMALFRYAGAMI